MMMTVRRPTAATMLTMAVLLSLSACGSSSDGEYYLIEDAKQLVIDGNDVTVNNIDCDSSSIETDEPYGIGTLTDDGSQITWTGGESSAYYVAKTKPISISDDGNMVIVDNENKKGMQFVKLDDEKDAVSQACSD